MVKCTSVWCIYLAISASRQADRAELVQFPIPNFSVSDLYSKERRFEVKMATLSPRRFLCAVSGEEDARARVHATFQAPLIPPLNSTTYLGLVRVDTYLLCINLACLWGFWSRSGCHYEFPLPDILFRVVCFPTRSCRDNDFCHLELLQINGRDALHLVGPTFEHSYA